MRKVARALIYLAYYNISLLFFASGVLGSCALDYFLKGRVMSNRKAEHFLFILTPLLILTLTIISYIVAAVDSTVGDNPLAIIQGSILLVTFTYLSVYTAYERSVSR